MTFGAMQRWASASALLLGTAIGGCGGGTTMQLRANQASVFYVDGVEVGRGRFVAAKVRATNGTVTVVAKADGYKDKTEYLRPPLDDKDVSFVFEVGDRLDGKDSWGRKIADVAPTGATPASGPQTPAAAEPLAVPITVRSAPSDARFAVVVGIESYSNDLPKADGALRDAATFGSVAAQALGVPASHVVMLSNEHATRTGIEARLKEWLPRVLAGVADSEVYFFFAGHGAPEPTSGDAYLVPWDADPKFLRSQGLRVSEVHAALAASGAKSVYVFLDSCFSGAGGRSVLAAGTRPLVRVKEEGITTQAQIPTTGLRVYASYAAAGAGEITGRARDADAGLFTFYLTSGLGGAADANGDKRVTLGELFDFVRSHVEHDARMDNRDQTPAMLLTAGDASSVIAGR